MDEIENQRQNAAYSQAIQDATEAGLLSPSEVLERAEAYKLGDDTDYELDLTMAGQVLAWRSHVSERASNNEVVSLSEVPPIDLVNAAKSAVHQILLGKDK